MDSKMKKILILVTFLFLGCETPQDSNKKEIELLKANQVSKTEIMILRQQIRHLEQKLNKLTAPENNNLKQNIHKLQEDIDELNNKFNSIEIVKNNSCEYVIINPTTLVTTQKTKIYSSSDFNPSIITEWDKCISFTSYREANNFVKITGYFIDGKWKPNKKEWWIPKENVKVKRVK